MSFDPNDPERDGTLKAIAIMTASLEADIDEHEQLLLQTVSTTILDEQEGEFVTAFGLVNLCTYLLNKRQEEKGIAPADTLRELALNYE